MQIPHKTWKPGVSAPHHHTQGTLGAPFSGPWAKELVLLGLLKQQEGGGTSAVFLDSGLSRVVLLVQEQRAHIC